METTPPDFDQLSAKAYAEGASTEDKHALWQAVFGLQEWNFIARGQLPEVTPYVASNEAVANGQYMLKVFTDAKKLHAFATANQLTDERGNVQLLTMPVNGFVDSAENYQKMGVFGVHFNADAGSNGFYAPLPQLIAIRDFIRKVDATKA